MNDDVTALADVLFEATYHSRRSAKRLIRDSGGHGSAEELDALLDEIKTHPQRAEIETLAGERHVAERAAVAARLSGSPEDETPAWLFAESRDARRWFVVHLCPGGAWSFVGEIFDNDSLAPDGMERYPLSGGSVISNILWLDGDPPQAAERRELLAEARKQLAIYDEGLEFDMEDKP